MSELNGPRYYHYNIDVCPSTRNGYDGDDEEVTVMFRYWRLNQIHPDIASVTTLQHGEFQIKLRDFSTGADADRLTLDLRECLTWFGVPQASHAELIAVLLEHFENVFLNDGRLIDEPRHDVIMDIVEAWGPAEHLVLENAVRVAVGMEVVREETEWLGWWETLEIGVPEPSLIDGEQFLERVLYIRFVRSLEMQEQRLPVQDDLDEVMRESMEVYTVRTVPASEEAIRRLEKVLEGEDLFCAICNEEEEEEQQGWLRTPCRHVFHTKCIETWFRIGSTCPLCRYVMS